jgi:hypothetical protein
MDTKLKNNVNLPYNQFDWHRGKDLECFLGCFNHG